MKKENDVARRGTTAVGTKNDEKSMMVADINSISHLESDRKFKEMEKRITKMRNENQEQKLIIDKATRLLEREIGEIVDINELSKDES